jgi:hypothetical protein
VSTKAASGNQPFAIPGEDGYVADEDGDAMVTGSIAAVPKKAQPAVPGADGEFDDAPEVAGSIGHSAAAAAADAAIRAEERRSAFH